MVLYHLAFDRDYFAVYDIDVFSGFWLAVARLTASLFLLLVGLSLTLSHARVRRLRQEDRFRLRGAASHRPLAADLPLSSAEKSKHHFWIIIYIIGSIFAYRQRRFSLDTLAGISAAWLLFGGLLSSAFLVQGDSGGNGLRRLALSRLPAQDSCARSRSVPNCESFGIPGQKLAGRLPGSPTGDDCSFVSLWCHDNLSFGFRESCARTKIAGAMPSG